jgi:hypothetical protein
MGKHKAECDVGSGIAAKMRIIYDVRTSHHMNSYSFQKEITKSGK